MSYFFLLRRALNIFLQEGPRSLITKTFIYINSQLTLNKQYQLYLHSTKKTEDDIDTVSKKAQSLSYRPIISIVAPVFNADERWLRLCIESVSKQAYDNWELCIANGNSKPYVQEILEEYGRCDGRIKIKYLKENKGIAGNSNEALALATGEFVGFLDHDDELTSSALYEVAKLLNENEGIDFIYSDEDNISVRGKRISPHFKPDWSPDTFRSYNYICHFSVIRKKILDDIGGLKEGYEGAQDYDLFLRVVERTQRIAHIPKVLYHWRQHASSSAGNLEVKRYAFESAKRALRDHIKRIGLVGDVCDGHFLSSYRIKYHVDSSSMVTIIIPTRDKVDSLKACINSVLLRSTYNNYDILIVDNKSVEEKTFKYFKEIEREPRIKILRYDKHFNYSAINNFAVSKTDSEYLIFLNNDTEVISPDWIESMLEFAQREDVGVVGALLHYPNNLVQHAGIIIGVGGVAGHSHKKFRKDYLGYFGRIKITQNMSAVTAACMMTKKSLFMDVDGFDVKYSHAFNDIDFCLKIREKNYLVVYTPYAELYHHESLTRGNEDTSEKKLRFKKECEYFKRRWKRVLDNGDPYYNPNLTLQREDFSLKIT